MPNISHIGSWVLEGKGDWRSQGSH